MSRKEASSRLAIAEGTLSSRLATARKKLAVILKRKEVTLPAGTLAVTATVPHTLVHAAVNTAMNPDHLTSTMQILFKAGVSMLVIQKLKYSLVVVAILSAFTGGVSFALAKPNEPGETLPLLVTARREPIIKDNVWDRFQKICGSSNASRKLFDDMMSDEKQAKAIRDADKSDEAAFGMYTKMGEMYEKQWFGVAFNEFNGTISNAENDAKIRKKSLAVFPSRIILQHLYLGTHKVPEKEKDSGSSLIYTASFVDLMQGTEKETAIKLYLAWLEQRKHSKAYEEGLRGSLFADIKEILPYVRKRIVDPNEMLPGIGSELLILGNLGEKSDAELIEKFLKDETKYRFTREENPRSTQIRDTATTMYLKMHGEDPDKFGFDVRSSTNWWCSKGHIPFTDIGIITEDKRTIAFKQFKKWQTENVKKK